MLPAATEFLNKGSDAYIKGAAAFAIGCAGEKAKSQADEIAKLLTEVTEDTRLQPNVAAGIERRMPAEIRIPACAAITALAQIDGEKYVSELLEMLSEGNVDIKVAALTALGDVGAKSETKVL